MVVVDGKVIQVLDAELMVNYPESFDATICNWLLEQDLEHYRMLIHVLNAKNVEDWLDGKLSSHKLEVTIRRHLKLQKVGE